MGRVATNALLLVLAGCNQFFDLDTTQLTDASHPFFDAAPDAPPMCADPSMTPRFDRELHQAVYIDEKCESYQTSAVGLALAACDLSKLNPAIREAPVGPWKEMTLAKGNIQQANVVYNLALAPEGNEVFLARYDAVLGAGIWRYARDANGAWNLQEKLPVTFTAAQRISTVTRGPKRHMFVIETNQQLHEWATDDNGTWSSVRTSTATNLGVNLVFGMDMSADGRRMLMFARNIQSVDVMTYSYRDSIDVPFRPAVTLPDSPGSRDAFLSEDCDRMYFSGLDAVFYVRRLP